MTDVPRPHPQIDWRPDLGGKGTLFPLDADDIETPITPSADGKIWVSDSSQPSGYAETDLPVVGTAHPIGFGTQVGDKVNLVVGTGYGGRFRAQCDGAITDFYFDADIAVTATFEVKKNGTSIFSGTAVKPTLTAATSQHKTDMTDIDVDFVEGDLFEIILDSNDGSAKALTLTILGDPI